MMADRVIRDELLTSERYWSASIEAQRLFVHLLLNADDTARFSGKNYTIRSACFPGQGVEPDKVERMLSELNDTDLIRLYTVDSERFVFIPRFKQRLRFKKSRYPAPPKEISDLEEEKSDSSQSQDSPKSDSRRQKRSEEKRSKPEDPPNGGPIWSEALTVLTEQGISEKSARAFLGMVLRDYSESDVLDAVKSSVGKAQATSYILGILKTKAKKGTAAVRKVAIG